MEKSYNHKESEKRIIAKWKASKSFNTAIDKSKEPYTIILPPPNASGKMHIGNALMIAIEDLLIRWKRMNGFSALWIPGTDHAGFETQTTFERELKKKGKTRFDFDRKTLYQDIWDFVQQNKSLIEEQIDSMGASVDWDRYTFTLDPRSVKTVLTTFKKMYEDGLIYRADYLVNYSFKWGTTFSDAEIVYKEQVDPLYYIKYGPFVLATVRPETKFGDTALAVHPEDPRYKDYIGKEIEADGLLGKFKIKVIADNYVDPEFGTGVVKITPAHDKNDFEVGRRHNLEVKSVIGIDGRLNHHAGKYAGLKIMEARKIVAEDLKAAGLIERVDENYTHLVPVDYRSGDYIENLVLPNWFVNVDHEKFSLKMAAAEALDSGKMNIYPKWREITYRRWVESMHDWAISRQIVWGIQIPAWYNALENPMISVVFIDSEGKTHKGMLGDLLKEFSISDIESGLQNLFAPKDSKFVVSETKPGADYLQDTDTFDTWFSSGQWPLITTGFPDSEDYKYFYPTSVLETGWEIVTRWVSRMVMLSCYMTGQVPFKDVYLHGHVRAVDGRKMSKSLGNVINPEDYMSQYGTDALRMGLISGTANGKDFNFPHDKVLAYKNFSNKIWNMARFMNMMVEKYSNPIPAFSTLSQSTLFSEDQEIIAAFDYTLTQVNDNLEKYRFADAAESIYHFMWDELASKYIELVKNREDKDVALSVLIHVYTNCLKMLHPFMPFVTEELWEHIPHMNTSGKPLILENWPKHLTS